MATLTVINPLDGVGGLEDGGAFDGGRKREEDRNALIEGGSLTSSAYAGGASSTGREHQGQGAKKLITRFDSKQEHLDIQDMTIRKRLAFESGRLWWTALIIVLVLVDFVVFISEASRGEDDLEATRITTVVSLVVSIVLCLEWMLRLFANGPSRFLCCPSSSSSGARSQQLAVVFAWIDFFASFAGLIIGAVTMSVIADVAAEADNGVLSPASSDNAEVSSSEAGSSSLPVARYFSVVTLARLIRILRLVFVIFTNRSAMINATRRLVSQNRRRFKDAEFDLDLTYVTDGVIAMSLPAHKQKDKLYRNFIGDVARFFEVRHKDKYVIYNVTSERRYKHSWFKEGKHSSRTFTSPARLHTHFKIFWIDLEKLRICLFKLELTTPHYIYYMYVCVYVCPWLTNVVRHNSGRVVELDIDDHNPCPLLQIQGFCQHIHHWLGGSRAGISDRVAAIHCKGGKGRTGTMICCYLMHSGMLDDFPGDSAPDNALAYFASRRTDTSRGSTYQGVQTPSQARFIRYYAAVLKSSLLKSQIMLDPPVFVLESARIVNAPVPENVREKVGSLKRKMRQNKQTEQKTETGKDGILGSVFTMLVYDGMDAVRLRKSTSTTKSSGEAVPEASAGEMPVESAQPRAVIPSAKPRHGKYGTFVFDVEHDAQPLYVRGDVKVRILSPWTLPGKKYDDCFVYFWFHTSFLQCKNKNSLNVELLSSVAEANMPTSGGVVGDGGVASVGTSDVRLDPESPEDGVILTLHRDRLDNGHHKANRRALPGNFAVEMKFRRVPSKFSEASSNVSVPAGDFTHHNLGSYRPRKFDPPLVLPGGVRGAEPDAKATASQNAGSRENGKVSDSILDVQSPWSRS